MAVHPERFAIGDFHWFGFFARCVTANGWGEMQKLHKLPAYLNGTAAEYYDLLTAPERETYVSLISSLCRVLIPNMYREYYQNQFYSRIYCPDEDPRLRKADSELDATAQDALDIRQFLTCLKADYRTAQRPCCKILWIFFCTSVPCSRSLKVSPWKRPRHPRKCHYLAHLLICVSLWHTLRKIKAGFVSQSSPCLPNHSLLA